MGMQRGVWVTLPEKAGLLAVFSKGTHNDLGEHFFCPNPSNPPEADKSE
jgi:hypothetical protein